MKKRVLVFRPESKVGVVEEINGLDDMQKLVGGYIEMAQSDELPGLDIVCNEEGKIKGLPLNRPLHSEGQCYDIISGTCFLCRVDKDGETISVTDEDIAKYKEWAPFSRVDYMQAMGRVA